MTELRLKPLAFSPKDFVCIGEVGLYGWIVKVSWLGKLVSVF